MPNIPGSVPLGGFIAPTSPLDTYALQDDAYNRGGFRPVADIAARDALTADRRKEGMLVKVLLPLSYYTLQGGVTNAHWVLESFGGGGGGLVRPYLHTSVDLTLTGSDDDYTIVLHPDANDVTVRVDQAADVPGRVYCLVRGSPTNQYLAHVASGAPGGGALIVGKTHLSLTKEWESVSIHSVGTGWVLL